MRRSDRRVSCYTRGRRELRIDDFIPQLVRESRLDILQRPLLPPADLPQRLLEPDDRVPIALRAQVLRRGQIPRAHLQRLPFLGPVRARVEPHRRVRIGRVAHPPVADRLHEGDPLPVVLGVGDGQHFDGGGEAVAGLRGHDQVAPAHDAEFQREAHGCVLVLVLSREGAKGALQERVGCGSAGRVVNQLDHVPPSFLDDGEIRLTVLVGDGNLEFHVSHAHVLDLRSGIRKRSSLIETTQEI